MGDRWTAGKAVLLLLLASTLLRLALAWGPLGFLVGDDVEVLATAFRRAAGLEYEPWRLRSLLLPEVLVAPWVWAGRALGVEAPDQLVRLALAPFVLLGSLSLFLLYRLTRAWTGEEGPALLAAGLYAGHPLFLAYTTSALPRVAAVAAILGAALLLSGPLARPGPDLGRGALAGTLVSLAFACRYSEVVFLLPLAVLIWLRAPDRPSLWRRGAALAVGFLLTSVLAVGVYDLATWGEPFASLGEFARFTLVEKQASARVAEQPFLWYLRRLPRWLPLPLLALMALARGRGSRPAWAFLALPLLVLSFIHHKDLRYLQGALPFACLLAGAGAARPWAAGRRRVSAALIALALALGLATGVRMVQRKSLAAVAAAREMAREPGVGSVVLSQAWAWGDRLFLGNRVDLRRISTPPTAAELAATLPGADLLGLYLDDLAADPALAETAARHGFVQRAVYERGRSRAVVVFGRAG